MASAPLGASGRGNGAIALAVPVPLWVCRLRRNRTGSCGDGQTKRPTSIHFDQSLMAIEASKQGQGVVMAGPLLVEDEIADRTLIEPFEHHLPLNAGYFVVYPRESALPLYQRALAIVEVMLGPAHPTTATLRANYVALLEAMKR